jgi:type IV pilus assembly protein PilQ
VVDLRGGVAPQSGGTAEGSTKPSTAANFPATGPIATAFSANPFALAMGWLASNFALDIQLQALEGERRARVVSRPSLMTLDNQPATIASGTKFPIISVTSVGGAPQASITFQDVTTRLQVTPRVVPDTQKLLLGIAVKRETVQGTVSAGTLTAPIVNTRNTVTQAEIPDGGTLVLGGLREDFDQNENQGVPWLKKIPVLGWLFKNDLIEAQRRELVVFLTAKVADASGRAAVTPAELPVGPQGPPPPGPTGQLAPPKPAAALASAPAAEAPIRLPVPAGGSDR